MNFKNYMSYFLAVCCWVAMGYGTNVWAQCTIDNTCGGDYANVVIGEVSGDAAQSDACNDAIVEIIGPPGTNIGCMVLTDTEWAVLIPPGTVIPADGVFLVACGEDLTSSCGVGINGSSNGIACAECDFPNLDGAGAAADGSVTNGEIDLDVCDPDAVTFYDPAATGFTLDNPGPQSLNSDGEQVFLFLPDGTPWDGIIWDGGGTGNSDHATISGGGTYTLGDNDGNGVVNDNAGTVGGGRGDGGNATAVPILPTDAGCPCNTPDAPGTFTVPAYTPGSTTDLWMEWTTSDHAGCNSSFIRGPLSGMGFGGSPSHTDGLITSTGVDAMGQPLDNGGGATGGTTGDAFDPNTFTNTACNSDPSTEWGYTDHPTPGQPNNDPAWVFYASETILCDPATPVTFTAEIYNYQHVSDNADTQSGVDNGQTGSYVFDPILGSNQVWTTYSPTGPGNETTIMTYTVASFPGPGTYSFGVVWDDFSNCCGTSGDPHTQSNPNECYEETVFEIVVAEPLLLDCGGETPCVVDCPGDSPQGIVDANTFISGGSGDLTYTLYSDNPATNQLSQNTNGIFSLPTSATNPTAGNYTIVVEDNGPCPFPPVEIQILDNCEIPPICPENYDTSNSSVSDGDAVCPGQELTLCMSVEQVTCADVIWSVDCGSGFETIDVTPNPTVAIVALQPNAPGGDCDGAGPPDVEYFEVQNLSPTQTIDISGYTVVDAAGNDVTLAAGTILPPCATIQASLCDGGSNGVLNNSGGDSATIFDTNGNQVGTTVSYTGSASTGQIFTFPVSFESCITYIVPNTLCPTGNCIFRAELAPFDSDNCPADGGDEADALADDIAVTISCPDAVLTPAIFDVCQADANTVDIPVTITGGVGPFTLEYSDGTTTTSLPAFASGDMITITGPTAGEIKISLVSITDEGGALCAGSVNSDEVCVNIRPEPTATISSSSQPLSCAPCDGSITFDYGGSNASAGPFDIEYTANGASQIVAGVTFPYTISGLCPGEYDIVSILDDASCVGTVTPAPVTLTAPAGTPLSVTNDPAAVCGNGTQTIDLSTDVTYSETWSATDFEIFDTDPNTLPTTALANTPSPLIYSSTDVTTSTVVTVSATSPTTYYVQYTDANGCQSVAPVTITIDNDLCAACDITAATAAAGTCDDNNTPFDTTDDFFTFTISDVTQADATFTNGFTFDGTPLGLTATETGGYGAGVQYTSGNVDITTTVGSSPYTITLADADDPLCTFDIMVTVPQTCSPCTDIVIDAQPSCAAVGGTFDITINSITGGDAAGGTSFNVTESLGSTTTVIPAAGGTISGLTYSNQNDKVTLTIADAANPDCTTTFDVLQLDCSEQTPCDCDNANPFSINAQASANGDGYSMVYVLVDGTGVATVNQTGAFGPFPNDGTTYTVYAFNVEDGDLAAMETALNGLAGGPIDDALAATVMAPFDGFCYTEAMAMFTEDCVCDACPTVTTPASGVQNFCGTPTPDLTDATTLFVGGTPSGNSTATLMWYCDQAPDAVTAPATPYTAACLTAPADNCSPVTTTLYAYYVCDLDGDAGTTDDLTYLDAGSIDVVEFPTPTLAEVTEGPGCSLTATPNCPGTATGTLTIWYPSTPGGTDYAAANPAPSGTPNDGDTYNYIAFVTGAEATTPPIAPAACGFEGTVTALCNGCPTIGTPASGTQEFCGNPSPDFTDATTGFAEGTAGTGGSTATLQWFCDQAPDVNTAPATPYTAACLNAPADNCSPASTTIYAYYVCDEDGDAGTTNDINYLAAGSITVVDYPTPTLAEVTEGPDCLLTATPNCPGTATGTLTIWYPSTPGGTDYAAANPAPSGTPNDGDTYNYVAFVTGADAATCGFEGTVTATCLVPAIMIDKDDSTPGDPDTDGDDIQTVPLNGTATFTITITNTGNEDLCNVVLDDVATDGALGVAACIPTFASIDTDNGTVAPGAGDGIFAIGDVESYTCTVTGVTQDFTNEIFVDAVGCDTGIAVDDDDPTDVVVDIPGPDIAIDKDDSTPGDPDTDGDDIQVSEDGTATFTITITNTGDEDLCNVVLDDVATDAGIDVSSCIPTFASIDSDNGAVAPGAGDGIFAVGDVESYTCTVAGVTEAFTNEIFVDAVGCGSGIAVDDDDPTEVVLCDLDILVIPDYQGNEGGITPFYFNKVEIDVYNGTLPYTYDWDAVGYVRNAQINTNDNTAYPDGDREFRVIYGDNAIWALTVTDARGCVVYATNDPEATGEVQEVLDIHTDQIEGDNCITRGLGDGEGSIIIDIENGTAPYTLDWSGPFTWQNNPSPQIVGTGIGAVAEGRAELYDLPYGWYSVTVTDSGDPNGPFDENGYPEIDDDPNTPLPQQVTEGWYWVDCIRPSGRGKEAPTNENTLNVFPNPLSVESTIEFGTKESGEAVIELYDMNGAKLINLFNGEVEGGIINSMVFTPGPLPTGIYILQITTPNGEVQMEKLVISKEQR